MAFEKYDGTNLHFDWDRDFGWHAFGTRRDAFNSTLADGLERVFRDHAYYREFQAVKAFAEFLGPGSFAGLHRAEEEKQLRLFDILAEPFGIIGPERFIDDFGHLPIARGLSRQTHRQIHRRRPAGEIRRRRRRRLQRRHGRG